MLRHLLLSRSYRLYIRRGGEGRGKGSSFRIFVPEKKDACSNVHRRTSLRFFLLGFPRLTTTWLHVLRKKVFSKEEESNLLKKLLLLFSFYFFLSIS